MGLVRILTLLVWHHQNKLCRRISILEIRQHGVERTIKRIGFAVRAFSNRTIPKPEIICAAKHNHKVRRFLHRVHSVHKRTGIGIAYGNIRNP